MSEFAYLVALEQSVLTAPMHELCEKMRDCLVKIQMKIRQVAKKPEGAKRNFRY